MNMLIDELAMLGGNPWSWAVVGVIAIFALYSASLMLLCPYVHGRAEVSPADIQAARVDGFRAGPRFLVAMLGGVALTLTGLFMISQGIQPALALGALVAGVFIIQTEPRRLEIREFKSRVIAHWDAPVELAASQRDRLKAGHRTLTLTNFTLLAAMIAGLLAF